MKPLSQLVRPNILALQPYSTARDEYAGGGIGVWLDANESPYDNGVNRYPDPHQRELKAQLAALKGVRSGQIFLGNGSDEAIDLAFRIFCEPGRDTAVSIAPTYGMYRVAAQTNGVELREVPLGADFSLPVEALLAAADGRTKLLWLCSPNNPTGNAFPDREIEELLRRFDGVVVLDEAYIDFAEGRGFLPRLDEFPNLIVLQTLSDWLSRRSGSPRCSGRSSIPTISIRSPSRPRPSVCAGTLRRRSRKSAKNADGWRRRSPDAAASSGSARRRPTSCW